MFLIVFVILLNSINAQNEAPFETAKVSVTPPPPPEEDISKKYIIIFELKDYDSKILINDLHVNLEIVNKEANERINTLKYVGDNGLVKLYLSKGIYDITLKVDKIETNGRDNFIKFDQIIDNNVNKTVYLLSVGSVIGNVYDENGNAIKGAQIKVECSGSYGQTENKVSDKFGSFSLYWLPVGYCRISSMYSNRVGYKDIEIKKGELNNIDITLSTGILSGFNFKFIVILVLIAIVAEFIRRSYITRKKKNAIKKETKEKELSSRTEDIIKTLKDNEKYVVNFLLDNDYKSTQATIRHNTGIPRTSLSRILKSLETKKIVEVEKVGKLIKVRLTPWFLGKEEIGDK